MRLCSPSLVRRADVALTPASPRRLQRWKRSPVPREFCTRCGPSGGALCIASGIERPKMPVMPSRRIFPSAATTTPGRRGALRRREPEAVIKSPGTTAARAAHPRYIHPAGRDTWTVLSGQGLYQTNADGDTRPLKPGDIAITGWLGPRRLQPRQRSAAVHRSSRPQRRATSACRTPPEIGTSPERASGRGLLLLASSSGPLTMSFLCTTSAIPASNGPCARRDDARPGASPERQAPSSSRTSTAWPTTIGSTCRRPRAMLGSNVASDGASACRRTNDRWDVAPRWWCRARRPAASPIFMTTDPPRRRPLVAVIGARAHAGSGLWRAGAGGDGGTAMTVGSALKRRPPPGRLIPPGHGIMLRAL